MNKSASSASGEHAKTHPIQIPLAHHAGDWVDGNIWYKIGLSHAENFALSIVRERLFREIEPRANRLIPARVLKGEALRALVVTALAHYPDLDGHLLRDFHYAGVEGFNAASCYQDALIKETFGFRCLGFNRFEQKAAL